jgi:oligoribonuclease
VLAWIDLEMTGLDPTRHVIVEIASLVTDDDLTIVAEGPDLVISATPEQLAEMDDFVTKMHTSSGLLEEIASSSLTAAEAEAATLDFLRQHLEAGAVPLAGNSIGTDRRFLDAQMPELEAFFHYRSVDVSTLKELGRRWMPDAVASAPTKSGGHRALDDIRESVAELAHYRSTMFTTTEEHR